MRPRCSPPAATTPGTRRRCAAPPGFTSPCRWRGSSSPPAGDRPLIAIDPEGERLGESEFDPRSILAFGTERYGLSEALLERADARLAIPMREGVSSLNLATTVSAVLFSQRL